MLMFSTPVVLKSRKASDRTEALNNIRQIGLALFEFEADYGSFPSAATIPDVKVRTSTLLTLDDSSSNKLFRQLIANGLKSEKPFWAKTNETPKKPDDGFNSDATALAKGECAFSYAVGLKSTDDPGLPIVMTPMISGTRKFSTPKSLGEKAIVLRLDNSATALQIRQDNNLAHVGGGRTLFDPSVWGSVKPDLRWPE
jgi:hypothetical protein